MSNNKQSSIDVLISGLLEYIHEAHHLEVLELYEQAKAMHKEEQINTFKHAQVLMVTDSSKRAEQYYNETFGE